MSQPVIRALFVLPRAQYAPDTILAAHLLQHLRGVVEPAACFLEDGPLTSQWAGTVVTRAHALAPDGQSGSRRRAAEGVATMVRYVGAQVVHAIGPAAQLVAGKAAQAAGIPALWSQPGITQWGRLRDLRASLSPASAVLLHSSAGEQAQRKLFFRRARCRRVTAGVALPERLREHRRAAARAALGIPEDAVVAASAGPLDEPGMHDTFLTAARSLCNARTQSHLVIAGTTGSPESARALGERVAALGLGPRTRILGPWDLVTALDAADIAVHGAASSMGEPLIPVGLLQSLASGTALVVQDGPLVDELVEHGRNAVRIPPGQEETLALVLLALADDPDRRLALARAAAATARDHHDAARMAEEVVAVYREILAS